MMKTRWFLHGMLLAGSAAMAQPAHGVPSAAERQAQQAQRRAELRQALQAERQPAAKAPGLPPRQLSPQERQSLREQLRQQQQGAVLRPAP